MKNRLQLKLVKLLICATACIIATIYPYALAYGATSDVKTNLYLADFYDAGETSKDWSVIDANNDGVTWSQSSSDGQMQLNTSGNISCSDDWLISPTLNLTNSYIMLLDFETEADNNNEDFEVYIINGEIDNDTSNYKLVAKVSTFNYNSRDTLTLSLEDYIGDDFRVGIRCTSSSESNKISINEFSIKSIAESVLVYCSLYGDGYCYLNSGSRSVIELYKGWACAVEFNAYSGSVFTSWRLTDTNVTSTFSGTALTNIQKSRTYIVLFKSPVEITDSKDEYQTQAYSTINISHDESSTTNFEWYISDNNITADEVNLYVESDGSVPEIVVTDGGSLTAASMSVHLNATAGIWNLMAIPFDINIEDIKINDEAAVYGDNILVRIYNSEKRAQNSVEGNSASGWEEQTSGTILKNEGFAIAIDGEDGVEQRVTFSSTGEVVIDNEDKTVPLNRYESTVNNGGDSDWNLKGNPHHETHTKGTGYVLYLYNREDNSYDEYSSVENTSITPYSGWFVQSDDDFTELNFSLGSNVDKDYNSTNGAVTLTINGNADKAKMFITDGASAEYVKNEDALHISPLNNNLAQIYYVDENGESIASSVVPEVATTTKVAYKATEAGTQSITITTNITDAALYLGDTVTGTSTLMTDGTIYEFESATGTFTNRFNLTKGVTTTGIIPSATTSNIKILTTTNGVVIEGADVGSKVLIHNSGGTQLHNSTTTSPQHTFTTTTKGVIIININGEVFKCIL